MIADDPNQWDKAEAVPVDDPHAAERARIKAEYEAANPGAVVFWVKVPFPPARRAPVAPPVDERAETDAAVDRITRLFGFPRPQPQGPTE